MLKAAAVLIAVLSASAAHAADPAMAKLDMMKGVWSGPAQGIGADGSPFTGNQTERVGALLDGDVLAVEGRNYGADGALGFNAFGVISHDTQTGGYEFRTYADGFAGTYPLKIDGQTAQWDLPAGPSMHFHFLMDFSAGTWHETGQMIADGRAPVQILDMTLTRVSDTDWPAAGAVKP